MHVLVTGAGGFVGGYLAVWGLFSVAATAAQSGLDQLALLSATMVSASALLGGGLLIGAGVYQLTPYKHACLSHCRAPAHFISHRWRRGFVGAFRMGLALGTYCLGCCWVLMGLLFVGGVMNLVWLAAISVFIVLEKTVSFAETGGRVVVLEFSLPGNRVLRGLYTWYFRNVLPRIGQLLTKEEMSLRGIGIELNGLFKGRLRFRRVAERT